LDEGKLQSYFDGELSIDMMKSVTSHLASCVTCAAAAREMEEESALLTSALAMEFGASVPTERLRERINEVVLGDRIASAQSTQKAGFFSGLFNFGTQRTLGYVSLAVVIAFAAIVAVVKMTSTPKQSVRKDQVATKTTEEGQVKNEAVATASNKEEPTVPHLEVSTPPTKRSAIRTPRKEFRAIPVSTAPQFAPVKLLPGERSYLQAIARLDSTIKSNGKSMRPALQAEYQRNLAVVDRAIAATRSAAKSNPNDPDAADFMFAAYQSKVDLLNTIADARVGGGRGH
jgi:anti-sigma factor RsiW